MDACHATIHHFLVDVLQKDSVADNECCLCNTMPHISGTDNGNGFNIVDIQYASFNL